MTLVSSSLTTSVGDSVGGNDAIAVAVVAVTETIVNGIPM